MLKLNVDVQFMPITSRKTLSNKTQQTLASARNVMSDVRKYTVFVGLTFALLMR